jgi:hypothetical protein
MRTAVLRIVSTLLLLAPGARLWGQSTTGELVGTITDASGAIVPQASIDVREVNTGAVRRGVSNARGDYIVRALPIGKYEVAVESTGFKRLLRPEVVVEVEQSVRADFVLEVGATSETVPSSL